MYTKQSNAQHVSVYCLACNIGMNEDSALRRENLRRLCKARGWGATELARLFTGRYTYWRDLLTNHTKPFGEKKARALEQEAELPRLWFDQALPEVPPPTAKAPAYLGEKSPPDYIRMWPFATDIFDALQGMSPEERRMIERTLRALTGLPMA